MPRQALFIGFPLVPIQTLGVIHLDSSSISSSNLATCEERKVVIYRSQSRSVMRATRNE